jgi:hypothetical protein
MAARITYYAIIDYRATREDPAGIARRRYVESGGFEDEALDRNMNWQFTPVIVEWKRAESTDDLVEISEDEAERIIEGFRAKWGAQG